MAQKSSENLPQMIERVKQIVPPLSSDTCKGQAGKIGILGGSGSASSAPYYAAITALKVGADAVHVFCPRAIAGAVKAYSPELIVHAINEHRKTAVLNLENWVRLLDVWVIGPGMVPDDIGLICGLVDLCQRHHKPMIVDVPRMSDISFVSTMFNYYGQVIIVLNTREFSKLFGDDQNLLMTNMRYIGPRITVFRKGNKDTVFDVASSWMYVCPIESSRRPCVGIGDFLVGALATFYHWALKSKLGENPSLIACFAASYLTKKCDNGAFKAKGRSMSCPDVIDSLQKVFNENFEL